jgi:hypothetical protein
MIDEREFDIRVNRACFNPSTVFFLRVKHACLANFQSFVVNIPRSCSNEV